MTALKVLGVCCMCTCMYMLQHACTCIRMLLLICMEQNQCQNSFLLVFFALSFLVVFFRKVFFHGLCS